MDDSSEQLFANKLATSTWEDHSLSVVCFSEFCLEYFRASLKPESPYSHAATECNSVITLKAEWSTPHEGVRYKYSSELHNKLSPAELETVVTFHHGEK